MRPGVHWASMHELAYRVLCTRLREAGLLRGDIEDMMAANVGAVFMPHGLGHLLGIDTHDVGGYPPGVERDERAGYASLRLSRPLEAGMVVTVEPGLYFTKHGLEAAANSEDLSGFFVWDRLKEFADFGGIRLEDNVLITEEGIENFTIAPRTIAEVEAVMRGEIVDCTALQAWRLKQ